jgi:hypothetical protein
MNLPLDLARELAGRYREALLEVGERVPFVAVRASSVVRIRSGALSRHTSLVIRGESAKEWVVADDAVPRI